MHKIFPNLYDLIQNLLCSHSYWVTKRTINSLPNQDDLSCRVWFRPLTVPSASPAFRFQRSCIFIPAHHLPIYGPTWGDYSHPPEPRSAFLAKLVLSPEPPSSPHSHCFLGTLLVLFWPSVTQCLTRELSLISSISNQQGWIWCSSYSPYHSIIN